MKVRITLTVEIDPEAWTLNYGVAGAPDIRADVRAYIADLTTEQLRTAGILAA
jgi:hypothetical protein